MGRHPEIGKDKDHFLVGWREAWWVDKDRPRMWQVSEGQDPWHRVGRAGHLSPGT